MRSMSPTAGEAANNSVARTVRNLPDTGAKSDAKTGSDWLPEACQTILGKDAGAQLHLITGYPERTCYRYASGESECGDDFLRTLFHSPQGAPFFAAFMHGCKAPWWLEHQRSVELAALSARFIAQVGKLK